MHKILIVEDDADNNQMLCDYLESHGYACAQAYSGSEGKLLFSMEHFDLVLLDLMLPGIPGEELVLLFAQKSPVIVLSAKSGLDSKVDVLSGGADDYLCKPFDLPELLVRIQVQLRKRNREQEGRKQETESRQEPGNLGTASGQQEPGNPWKAVGQQEPGNPGRAVGQQEPGNPGTAGGWQGTASGNASLQEARHVYSWREWTLDEDTQEMTAAGELVELTKHEFLILELLIRSPKRVFTKQMIYEYAWGEEYLAEDKTIHVHISNIRSKLKKSGTDSYIQTVWGMGFKLV